MSDKPPYNLLLDWMEEAVALAPTTEPVATGVLWRNSGVVSFSAGIPPTITDQPDNASASEGATAQFVVAATNATGYQWQKQEGGSGAFSNISGATSATYTTGTLTSGDNADVFRCVVTGPGGSTTSNTATLAIADADVTAFLTATGITDETISNAISQLVSDWKSAGMWGRTVAIYPFVGGSAATHKFNLKDPRDLDAANRLSFTGTITHSSNGADPNGSTGLANTFLDFNEQFPQYSLACGYYSRDNTTPGSGDYLLFGQNNMWFDLFSGTSLQVVLDKQIENTSPAYTTVTGMSAWSGLLGFSQNGPSSLAVYRNKTQLAHNTNAQFGYWSDTEPAANRHLRLFGTANGPGWAGKTDKECAFFFAAYAMDQARWNAISDIITTFQTALGRNV